jgi:hypothetical protein
MTIRLGGEESGVYPVSARHRVLPRHTAAPGAACRPVARLIGSVRPTKIRRARGSIVEIPQHERGERREERG